MTKHHVLLATMTLLCVAVLVPSMAWATAFWAEVDTVEAGANIKLVYSIYMDFSIDGPFGTSSFFDTMVTDESIFSFEVGIFYNSDQSIINTVVPNNAVLPFIPLIYHDTALIESHSLDRWNIAFADSGPMRLDGLLLSFSLESRTDNPPDSSMVKAIRFRVNEDPWAFLFLDADDTPDPVPGMFELRQNYPNPFNPSTTISYRLEKAGYVKLEIFDILGQKVATIVDGFQRAGDHAAIWDGADRNKRQVASGIYLYRLTSDAGSAVKQMMLVR